MKFKEKMNQAAGFTLVELIVVIAILAILAGVAVPAYSGYITQANKQSDITLAGEIEQALWLAFYNQQLGDKPFAVVAYAGKPAEVKWADGTSGVVDAGEAAMVAAFGENWKDIVQLKYDGWTTTAAEVDMSLIDSSSFSSDKHLDGLTERVSSLSGVLADYFGAGVTYIPLRDYMNNNSISSTDPQVLANLAVLQAANNITAADKTTFIDLYTSYDGNTLAEYLIGNLNLNEVSAYAVAYAKMEGMMNYIEGQVLTVNDPSKVAAFNTIKQNWIEESGKLTGLVDTRDLIQSTESSLFGTFGTPYCLDYVSGTQPTQDAEAFLSYMGGMDEVAPSLTEDLSGMASQDYYKGDIVKDILHTYISASNVLGTDAGSAIVIIYNGTDKVTMLPMSDK